MDRRGALSFSLRQAARSLRRSNFITPSSACCRSGLIPSPSPALTGWLRMSRIDTHVGADEPVSVVAAERYPQVVVLPTLVDTLVASHDVAPPTRLGSHGLVRGSCRCAACFGPTNDFFGGSSGGRCSRWHSLTSSSVMGP